MLKIIISDIRQELKFYILLIIQSLLAFIVIGAVSITIGEYQRCDTAIKEYDISDNYYGKSLTEVYTEHGRGGGAEEWLMKMQVDNFIAENFHTEGYSFINTYDVDRENELEGVEFVTKNFFELFELKLLEGRFFTEEEYGTSTLKNTPMIMSGDYLGEYKLGDMYKGKYEIVGFIDQNSSMMLPGGEGSRPLPLYNEKYIPVKSLSFMKENGFDYPTTLIYTEDKAELRKINEYAEKLGMYPYLFASYAETKAIIDGTINQVNIPMFIVSFIISVMALLCLIQAMLEFVRNNAEELLIHMMCGATLSDIILRVGAGTVLTAFISAVTAMIIFRTAGAALLISLAAVIAMIFSLVPIAARLKLKPLIAAVKEEK